MSGPYVRATCVDSKADVWLNLGQVKLLVHKGKETLVYYADHACWRVRETPEELLGRAAAGGPAERSWQLQDGVVRVARG